MIRRFDAISGSALRLLLLLPLLLLAPVQLAAQEREKKKGQEYYWALDRLLTHVEFNLLAPADEIARELRAGAKVTVESSKGMNVDASARILETLPDGRFRVETEGKVKTVTGAELRRLNLPFEIPNGAGVMSGGSRWAGPIALVDRVNDAELKRFLERSREVAREAPTDLEKLRKLTRFVNETIKYPGHETPDRRYSKIDSEYKGRGVAFGEYIKAGEGVCRHKALAMKLALEANGFPSRYVVGEALSAGTGRVRGGHAWVETITPDGRRLLVDPTWNDPGVRLEEAYLSGKLRRPKPRSLRIIPPGERPVETRAPVGGPDLFSSYRRADGTVDWDRVPKELLEKEGRGFVHFAFALFLKELGPVLVSGNPDRLREFADLLTSVDFFTTYGLFTMGAGLAEIGYDKLAFRRLAVRSQFVNGLLKMQLTMAAGVLATDLYRHGTDLDGERFAIDVASLGLSTAAVKTALEALRIPMGIRRLGRVARLGRMTNAFMWVYTAAETAIVLTVADEVNESLTDWVERRRARETISDALERLLQLPDDAKPARIDRALDRLGDAFDEWRRFLLTPLERTQAVFLHQSARIGREMIEGDMKAGAARKHLGDHPAIRSLIRERHGSIEAYARGLRTKAKAERTAELEALMEDFEKKERYLLEKLYFENRREDPYLKWTPALGWYLRGTPDGDPGDPGADHPVSEFGRFLAGWKLERRLGNVSRNRLQSYEDEDQLLSFIARSRPDWAPLIEGYRKEIANMARTERRLVTEEIQSGPKAEADEGLVDRVRDTVEDWVK